MADRQDQIKFHYLLPVHFLRHRKALKVFLLHLFKKEKEEVETVQYIFCTDEYLHQINKDHLKHDTYTDIITFQLNADKEPIISDIYISIDRVKENAILYQSSYENELLRVMFHGALHLCGYKDKSGKDKSIMRQMEDHYLKYLLVSRETSSHSI